MMHMEDETEMRCKLAVYTPGSIRNLQNHPYKRVCLQVFGTAGHGKKSFIHSCLLAAKDEDNLSVTWPVNADESDTTGGEEFKVNDNVYIADTQDLCSFQEEDVLEMAVQFCQKQTRRDWRWEERTWTSARSLLASSKNVKPVIVVPIFVHSAERPCTPQTLAEIDPFIREAWNITGIFPIVVIAGSGTDDAECTERTFRELGADFVFFVENYTKTDTERSPAKDAKILNLLNVCLQEADRGIQMKTGKDPQEEFRKQAVRLCKKEMELQEKLAKAQDEAMYKRNKRPETVIGNEENQNFEMTDGTEMRNTRACVIS